MSDDASAQSAALSAPLDTPAARPGDVASEVNGLAVESSTSNGVEASGSWILEVPLTETKGMCWYNDLSSLRLG